MELDELAELDTTADVAAVPPPPVMTSAVATPPFTPGVSLARPIVYSLLDVWSSIVAPIDVIAAPTGSSNGMNPYRAPELGLWEQKRMDPKEPVAVGYQLRDLVP